ncbi:biosynthetic arginine decarboxylase [Rubrivirga sp. IMCC45206]|uniref:biosynthetic arginine decarboxylase n=1 Tax=Rubrivirga sp. IMCC45206 TaxID=3391614 RepID=UPI00398FA720
MPDTVPAPAAPDPHVEAWTPADAEALYHMAAWGEGYFGVNAAGHVVARPDPRRDGEIDLAAVVEEVVAGGLSLPAVIRFQDLLDTRVRQLNEAFQTAIEESGYRGGYTGVYPVKVNQLREVVDEIVEAGRPYRFGLECGSKAELVATLPRLESDDTLCLVNGYKDAAMLRIIQTFQRLGRKVLPIIEKTTELDQILALSDEADQPARFGIRIKLASVAPGPWTKSGGSLSKFGITLPELVAAADRLIDAGRGDALRLLHFHLGSQIGDVGALKAAVKEITRIYAHLVRRGLAPEYLDVGGGLGVNYDALPLGGGRGGVDYSMQEYANAIVYAVQETCDAEGVPHPTIVSENGRALTAHHSVLVVDTLGMTSKPSVPDDFVLPEGAHAITSELDALRRSVPEAPGLGELLEIYHDAVEARQKSEALFQYGYLGLDPMALAETLYWSVCRDIHARLLAVGPDWVPPELDALGDALAEQVLCDFSVFQSLMDHWALGQRFPIVPVSRLDEAPTCRARLVDITCDSDGEIARFIAPEGKKRALEVHAPNGAPYRLGIFLVGAYQDILGDAHNLFGSVAEAHVYLDESEPSGYYVEETIPATTVEQMLARVQYFPSDLHARVQTTLRQKAKEGLIRPKEAQAILADYRAFFQSSTYLDPS